MSSSDSDDDSVAQQWERTRKSQAKNLVGAYTVVETCPDSDEASATSFTSGHEEATNPCEVRRLPRSSRSRRHHHNPPLHHSRGGVEEEGCPDMEQGTSCPQHNEHLVVALPVPEEENHEKVLPEALEYDPFHKPLAQATKNRLCYLLWCLVFFLAAIGVIASIVITHNKNRNDAHRHPREKLGIRQQLERLVGKDKLQELPYRKALDWIVLEDPRELTPEDDELEQRFIMAYIYFATTKNGPWATCNPINKTEQIALSTFSTTMESNVCGFQTVMHVTDRDRIHYRPITAHRWLSDIHECSWAGVKCDEPGFYVTSIELSKFISLRRC